jgi:hypothetical protein
LKNPEFKDRRLEKIQPHPLPPPADKQTAALIFILVVAERQRDRRRAIHG